MAVGDGWTSQLISNTAQFLHDNDIGLWLPGGGAYDPDDIAITDRWIPPEPDRCITLADYMVVSLPGMQDVTVGMQLRMRGTDDPRVVRDIGDACFELLDGLTNVTFGDIAIVQIDRQSQAALGEDENGRWQLSHNYYVQAMRRTANRTD